MSGRLWRGRCAIATDTRKAGSDRRRSGRLSMEKPAPRRRSRRSARWTSPSVNAGPGNGPARQRRSGANRFGDFRCGRKPSFFTPPVCRYVSRGALVTPRAKLASRRLPGASKIDGGRVAFGTFPRVTSALHSHRKRAERYIKRGAAQLESVGAIFTGRAASGGRARSNRRMAPSAGRLPTRLVFFSRRARSVGPFSAP